MRGRDVAQRIEDESNHLLKAISTHDMHALPEIYSNMRQFIFDVVSLEDAWCTEHDKSVRLEEQCKSLEAMAQAYKDMADEYYELWQALKEG